MLCCLWRLGLSVLASARGERRDASRTTQSQTARVQREPRPARFPRFFMFSSYIKSTLRSSHIRYISTSHHTTDQGPHIQAPCCRNFAGLLTAPRTQSRTPHPGRLRSCRRGQLCQPALTRVEIRGLVVGLPRPWPSSCHRPASLATPVGVGRPPRELRRRAGGSA